MACAALGYCMILTCPNHEFERRRLFAYGRADPTGTAGMCITEKQGQKENPDTSCPSSLKMISPDPSRDNCFGDLQPNGWEV